MPLAKKVTAYFFAFPVAEYREKVSITCLLTTTAYTVLTGANVLLRNRTNTTMKAYTPRQKNNIVITSPGFIVLTSLMWLLAVHAGNSGGNGLFPGTHLRLLRTFIHMIIAQQMEHGMDG